MTQSSELKELFDDIIPEKGVINFIGEYQKDRTVEEILDLLEKEIEGFELLYVDPDGNDAEDLTYAVKFKNGKSVTTEINSPGRGVPELNQELAIKIFNEMVNEWYQDKFEPKVYHYTIRRGTPEWIEECYVDRFDNLIVLEDFFNNKFELTESEINGLKEFIEGGLY